MMKIQVQRIFDILKRYPEGLSVLQITKAVNFVNGTGYASSTVNNWLKEAEKMGVVTHGESKGKRGRPAQIFKVSLDAI